MFGMFDPRAHCNCVLKIMVSRNLFGVLQGLAQYKMGPQHVYINRVKIPYK